MDDGLYRADHRRDRRRCVGSAVLHSWGEPLMHPELFEMIRYRQARRHPDGDLDQHHAPQRRARAAGARRRARRRSTWPWTASPRRPTSASASTRSGRRASATSSASSSSRRSTGAAHQGGHADHRHEGDARRGRGVRRRWQRRRRRPGEREAPRHLGRPGRRASAAHRSTASGTPMQRVPCPNLWYHGYIFWDGTLVSCERDYDAKTPLGNVKRRRARRPGTGRRCSSSAARTATATSPRPRARSAWSGAGGADGVALEGHGPQGRGARAGGAMMEIACNSYSLRAARPRRSSSGAWRAAGLSARGALGGSRAVSRRCGAAARRAPGRRHARHHDPRLLHRRASSACRARWSTSGSSARSGSPASSASSS